MLALASAFVLGGPNKDFWPLADRHPRWLQFPFTKLELEYAMQSIDNLNMINFERDARQSLEELITKTAHLPPKDWLRIAKQWSRSHFREALMGPAVKYSPFRSLLGHCLDDGGWDRAVAAAEKRPAGYTPWLVLLTGVAGARKKSSILQPWFKEATAHTLKRTHDAALDNDHVELREYEDGEEELPHGEDSFYLQLGSIIAVIANVEMRLVYAGPGTQLQNVDRFAEEKESIFIRYRTYALMLATFIIQEAAALGVNVIIEVDHQRTHHNWPADLHFHRYIEALFPGVPPHRRTLFPSLMGYRKLVLHYDVDDLGIAAFANDRRLLCEMKLGHGAQQRGAVPGGLREVIDAVQGGAQGKDWLVENQLAARALWKQIILADGDSSRLPLKDGEQEISGGSESWPGVVPNFAATWYKAVFVLHPVKLRAWRCYSPPDPVQFVERYVAAQNETQYKDWDKMALLAHLGAPDFADTKNFRTRRDYRDIEVNDGVVESSEPSYIFIDKFFEPCEDLGADIFLQNRRSQADLDEYLKAYKEKLEHWWLTTPIANADLDACMAAIGLSISTKLKRAYAVWLAAIGVQQGQPPPPPPWGALTDAGCEWAHEADGARLNLPDFPDFPAKFELPPIIPIPRLLPGADFLQRHSFSGATSLAPGAAHHVPELSASSGASTSRTGTGGAGTSGTSIRSRQGADKASATVSPPAAAVFGAFAGSLAAGIVFVCRWQRRCHAAIRTQRLRRAA